MHGCQRAARVNGTAGITSLSVPVPKQCLAGSYSSGLFSLTGIIQRKQVIGFDTGNSVADWRRVMKARADPYDGEPQQQNQAHANFC